MTTIRVARRPRFAQIDKRTVNDTALSFRSRGILVWLLDKPDNWTTTAERLETQGTEGREAIRSSLRELETSGYLLREKSRDGAGKWQCVWTVYERPQTATRLREAVDGSPQEVSRHSSTNTETETEISSDELRVSTENDEGSEPELSADPACPQCQGRGEFTLAGGGESVDNLGRVVPSASTRQCPCVGRERDTAPPVKPAWVALKMNRSEWIAAGCPSPAALEVVR